MEYIYVGKDAEKRCEACANYDGDTCAVLMKVVGPYGYCEAFDGGRDFDKGVA